MGHYPRVGSGLSRARGGHVPALAPELLYNSILTSPRLIVVPVADCGSQRLTVNVCVGAPSSGIKWLIPKGAARCRTRADPHRPNSRRVEHPRRAPFDSS